MTEKQQHRNETARPPDDELGMEKLLIKAVLRGAIIFAFFFALGITLGTLGSEYRKYFLVVGVSTIVALPVVIFLGGRLNMRGKFTPAALCTTGACMIGVAAFIQTSVLVGIGGFILSALGVGVAYGQSRPHRSPAQN